jgi:hypothetical protein
MKTRLRMTAWKVMLYLLVLNLNDESPSGAWVSVTKKSEKPSEVRYFSRIRFHG